MFCGNVNSGPLPQVLFVPHIRCTSLSPGYRFILFTSSISRCMTWSTRLGCSSAGPHSYLAWLMLAGVGLGTGNSGIWAFSQTLAGPRVVGRWCGLQNGFGNIAGVIGPALTGFTVDWTGHFQVAIIITATVCLLGAFVWVFLVGEFKQVIWPQAVASFAQVAS